MFAQAVFAGLFLGGNASWRQWHAVNGMLLIPLLALLAMVLAVVAWRSGGPGWIALASLALLLAIVLQSAVGQAGQVAVHVPLGVAILGLIGGARPHPEPCPNVHRPVRTQREAVMRITVFGATGRTERYLLAEGLRRDHQLTAVTPAGRQPWSARQHSRPSP